MKLYNRETSYYTIITIPKCLVSKYGKKQIWRSLNTKDYKLAKLRAELETMSIRRKLLNDLNKQKEKTSIDSILGYAIYAQEILTNLKSKNSETTLSVMIIPSKILKKFKIKNIQPKLQSFSTFEENLYGLILHLHSL